MFTGLVETTGVLAERTARGPGARLFIRTDLGGQRDASGEPGQRGQPLRLGESITVDGACLSVVEIRHDGFAIDASSETLACTTLGRSGSTGARVNLERAMRAGDRLGGHLVTGHVDAVGSLLERKAVGEAEAMTFALPAELARFVAEKGSITVSGVSLTVNAVRAGSAPAFEVMLIPITLRVTNLGDLAPGDPVNLEVDLVARYVGAWLERTNNPSGQPSAEK